jgi:hypothetical protein
MICQARKKLGRDHASKKKRGGAIALPLFCMGLM